MNWIVQHVDDTEDKTYGPFEEQQAKGKALELADECMGKGEACNISFVPLEGT